MSGVEVTGLVLGAIPLLIGAIEHYESIIESVSKYRKFSSKLRNLHDTLNLERTIFRAECVILLATDISTNEAENMLRTPSHPSWRDETFNHRMSRCFGSLGNAVKEVAGNMIRALGEIASKITEFDHLSGDISTNAKQSSTQWHSSVKAKLKFALSSQTSISNSLEILSKLNSRFGILSSQIRQLENLYPTTSSATQSQPLPTESLATFSTIRAASLDLYNAFAESCTAHHEHFLRFGFNGLSAQEARSILKPKIRFDIQYCTVLLCTPDSQNAAEATKVTPDHRLLIEISMGSGSTVSHSSAVVQELSGSSQSTTAPGAVSIQTSNEHTINRAEHGSLDYQLSTASCSAGSSKSVSDIFKLRGRGMPEYTVLSSQFSVWSHRTTSLAEVLCRVKQQGRNLELPQLQRLNLAEKLGTKVLQLHNTPWLARTLHSHELYFAVDLINASEVTRFGYTTFEASPLYMDIEVETRPPTLVQTANAGESVIDPQQQSRFGIRTGPPNRWLYNLGILLIELAYHMPFSNLVSEVKDDYAALSIPLSSNTTTAEYQIACQLAENIGSTMGAAYAGVVRRCLRCEFNVASSDLEDPELQRSVYENVVCKLRELVSAFTTL